MVDKHLKVVDRSTLPAACSELADFASDSVIVCDLDGAIRYWNSASETLYGWPAMATIGRDIAEFSPSPSLDAEHWRQLLREGHWHGPVRRRRSNGSHVTAAVRRIVRHNDAALPVEVVEYGRSGAIGVAGGDRSTWELQTSEERYRKLIHHMPTALWQIDARATGEIFDRLKTEGVTDIATFLEQHPELVELGMSIVRVTDVNREAIRLFRGRSAADLVGPIRYLFAATPDAARRVMAAHFEGRPNYIEQAKILTFDGQLRDVLICVTYPTPSEQQDTTFVTVEDVTERLRAEAQLRQHQADHALASRISTLGELATSIAHEVKQPLAAIVTNAETCLRWLSREPTNTEKLKQLTSRIISSARRASDIVQHVRSMAQSGERERLPLDVKELVEEALLFAHHDIESKHIKLTISANPSRPTILGNRIQLQQVVINLVVNSIQAISQTDSAERRIRIGIDGDAAGGLRFSIRDSGPGIAAQNLERVFDSFFTTKADGMGIGLALCHSIITAHGGSIQASNHSDGGACFRFSLPAAPQCSSAVDWSSRSM